MVISRKFALLINESFTSQTWNLLDWYGTLWHYSIMTLYNKSDNKLTKSVLRVPFDSLTLRAVTNELSNLLIGGQIQEIRQPDINTLFLNIRNNGKSHHLLLSCHPQDARIHLTQSRTPNSPVPFSFCMALRKHLENRRVLNIQQQGFDRILHITAGGSTEAPFTLIAELMGKHSNLVLVDSEFKIMDSARRISKRINRVRETLPGHTYMPPPEQSDRLSPFAEGSIDAILREIPEMDFQKPKALTEALMQIYEGMSPFLAKEIEALARSEDSWEAGISKAWESIILPSAVLQFKPVMLLDGDGSPIGCYPFPICQSTLKQKSVQSLSIGLGEAWEVISSHKIVEKAYKETSQRIHKELQRVERQIAAVNEALKESARYEEFRQHAELILGNLWQIGPETAEVKLLNYFLDDPVEITLQLDPTLTPQQNAEHLFSRYKRAKEAEAGEMERMSILKEEREKLLNALSKMEGMEEKQLFDNLTDSLLREGLIKQTLEPEPSAGKKKQEFEGHKIRRIITQEGYEILVGETATANDYLTLRIASPNDLWFHVRAAAGSHVVLRTHGEPTRVPRSVLMRAAEVCVQHSSQKHASLVSVDYTLKRYVRKPRGAAPGAADYTRETTIDIELHG